MKFLRMLAFVLALLLIPATATPAQAYGTGSFAIGNVQLLAYGCFYHPYTVNLNIGPETSDWDVDIRVLAPNGSLADFDYIDGVGTGPGSIPGELFFCSSLDIPGTYTITGTLSTYEGYYDYTATDVALAPVAFQVLAYVPPAPPAPPVVVPVFADVTGSVRDKAVPNGTKLTFKSNALPAGATLRKSLAWKLVVDGKVKKTFTQGPSNIRTTTVRFQDRSGLHVIKVLRNGKIAKTVRLRA